MIPYVDLALANGRLKAELLAAVETVLDHGQLILGPEVAQLEDEVADRLGAKHVVGVSSGTAALQIGLMLAGVGPGDEVIVPAHSFVATASAVVLAGARPVFADIDEETLSLDPARAAEAITDATRAIMPVHLSGIPADVARFANLCAERGVALVEDAAQAFDASQGSRKVGTFGVGCFSLHPLKVFSALGDGGLVSVDDDELDSRARHMRNLGLVERGVVGHVSGNDRLDTIQAAMLLVKLRHLDAALETRRRHAAAYRKALSGSFRLTAEPPGAEAVYSAFVMRHPRRDALITAMRMAGVDLKVHYRVPIHRQDPFAEYVREPLVVTDRAAREIFSVPVSSELSPGERDEVIEHLLDWARNSGGPYEG